MNKIVVSKIHVEQNGTLVKYDYEIYGSIKKYFHADQRFYVKYDKDISDTPESLLIIPLLSNLMPISWFVGFDVYLNECDETFLASLENLKSQFLEFFPDNTLKGNINVKKIIKNKINGNNTSLLFSGGLDSYDSLIRNLSKNPFLISIHGADVEIRDKKRWNEFVQFNNEETIIDHDRLFYIESNLREFYTYRVNLLTDLGWWGGIQHGMALLGVLAPLSFTYKITDIRIAASATSEVSYSWGSSPKIDENMKWANTVVTHDGYDQRRTDKIQNVISYVEHTKNPIKLRVCYAEERTGYNCNYCHKCQRTMLSIILSNKNPESYGFTPPKDLYERLFKNFHKDAIMTVGIKYQWECLQDMAKQTDSFFILNDLEIEQKAIERFANLNLSEIVNQNAEKVKNKKRLRLILRERLPLLHKIYQKIKN